MTQPANKRLVTEAAQAVALAGRAPVSSAWVASTAVKAGQILTNAGTAYTVNADFTTPATFSTTGLTAVAAGNYVTTAQLVLSDTRPTSPATGTVRIGLAVDSTPPTTPGTPTATGGNASASVTFTGSTDAVGVVGYHVYSSADAYASVLASGASSPIALTGLTNGTAVTFKVAAYDAAGNVSAKSAASNSVTPASVTTLVADNFNRANGSPVGAGSVGPAPTVLPAANRATIASNQLSFTTGDAIAHWAAGATDYTAQITMPALPCSANWRYTDDSNRYWYQSTGNIYLVLAGAYTLKGNGGAIPTGAVVKIIVSGSSHTVIVNGATVLTFTDASLTTGNFGVSANSSVSGSTFDDLTITTP